MTNVLLLFFRSQFLKKEVKRRDSFDENEKKQVSYACPRVPLCFLTIHMRPAAKRQKSDSDLSHAVAACQLSTSLIRNTLCRLFSRMRAQMLQVLLQSKDPNDLAAANALIKEMVKEVCMIPRPLDLPVVSPVVDIEHTQSRAHSLLALVGARLLKGQPGPQVGQHPAKLLHQVVHGAGCTVRNQGPLVLLASASALFLRALTRLAPLPPQDDLIDDEGNEKIRRDLDVAENNIKLFREMLENWNPDDGSLEVSGWG